MFFWFKNKFQFKHDFLIKEFSSIRQYLRKLFDKVNKNNSESKLKNNYSTILWKACEYLMTDLI